MKPSGTVTKHVSRILIVDDHPLVRQGMVTLIEQEPGLAVCAQTGAMGEAMALAREHRPDLAIVDLSLADGNGLSLVRRMRVSLPMVRVLVCSMHDEALFAHRAMKAGAGGYIGKEQATTRVVDAIRHVLSGGVWVNSDVVGPMPYNRAPLSGNTETINLLSNRELEVFSLIGTGLGPSKIAEQLHLSVKTIETHRENIKKKLNLRTGWELSREAIQWVLEQG